MRGVLALLLVAAGLGLVYTGYTGHLPGRAGQEATSNGGLEEARPSSLPATISLTPLPNNKTGVGGPSVSVGLLPSNQGGVAR